MTKILHIEEDLISKLDVPIDKTHLSVRDGRANTKYYYIKQAILANYLNQLFGPLGWDLKAGDPTIDRRIEARTKKRQNQNVTVDYVVFEVIIKVTLRIKARTTDSSDTIFQLHGVGSGEAEVGQNTKDELGKAIKGAESDGLKRCAQEIGRRFGLMLTTQGTQDPIDYAQANDNQRRQEMHRNENERTADERNNPPADRRDRRDEKPTKVSGERQQRAEREQFSNYSDNRRTRDVQHQDIQHRDEQSRDAKHKASTTDHAEQRNVTNSSNRNESVTDYKSTGGNEMEEMPIVYNDKAPVDDEVIISDQYDLDIVPMTTDEQISFAKTLLRVVGETVDRDREGLIEKHHGTVRGLDSRIKNRFITMLKNDCNIEFNAIRV